MDQFLNPEQIKNYDATRPKYTTEIFSDIINKTKSFNNYLDIACGCGQLLLQLSDNFKLSIGLDISKEQITKAKENLEKSNIKQKENVIFYESDTYDIVEKLNKNENLKDIKFDLITIGQAYHWYEEDKILTFLKSLLSNEGILVIAGYKKQHFDEVTQPDLNSFFESIIKFLLPYFECNVANIDSGYVSSFQKFKKYFSNIDGPKWFTEQSQIGMNKLSIFLKSWSAYVNYKKSLSHGQKDILDVMEEKLRQSYNLSQEDDLDQIQEKFYNYYFIIFLYDN